LIAEPASAAFVKPGQTRRTSRNNEKENRMGNAKKFLMQGLIAVAAVYVFQKFIGPKIGFSVV
jgi:hypothetical protein